MPEQTEPTTGTGGQQMPPNATPEAQQQFVANAQPVADALRAGGQEKEAQRLEGAAQVIANARKALDTTAANLKRIDEERDIFVRNAQPMADALRKSGKPVEAKQLEEAARVISQTKGLGPEQAGKGVEAAPAKEKTLKEIMDSVFAAIDNDPKLRNMPEAKNLRKASTALEKDGMLNITVRNGVVVSFASNFADNMSRTQKVASEPAGTKQAPAPAQQPTPAVAAATPVAAEVTALTVAPLQAAASTQAAAPVQALTDTAGPTLNAAPQVVQVVEQAPAIAPAPVQAPTAAIQAKGEVLYAAAPPMPDGVIRKEMLSNQAAHYSLFQIKVDPNDSNRAILLPAPGKDDMLVNALKDTIGSVYQVSGQPEIGKRNLAVETPTRLERTPDGWRVAEKGRIGFSAGESVYQAPQVVQVQQPTPQPAQVMPFNRADMPEALLTKLGVQLSDLEKSGQLEKLLQGKKTDLIEGFSLTGQSGEPIPFSAKLVMHRDEQGVATLKIDLPKHDLVIPKEIMGKTITPAMQVELQKNGVLPLTPGFTDGHGRPFSAYLGVDKQMNRVVAVRPEAMALNIPKEVLGVKLDPEVSRQLLEGKATKLVGMTNSKKQVFDATVQLDPVKRQLTFREVQPHQVEQVQQVQQRRRGLGA